MQARFDFFGSGEARPTDRLCLDAGPRGRLLEGRATGHGHVEAGDPCRHRVTVEQMAILEPALSETVAATCIAVIREAMEEAIARGVPAEAARDFLMGHVFCRPGYRL